MDPGNGGSLDDVCFFIAPIGENGSPIREHSDAVLQAIVRPAAEQNGLVAVRADEISDPGNITDQVIEYLYLARVVVADLTNRNPNVFYELAVRQAFNLPVVPIAREGEVLPFDVTTERVLWLDLESGPRALSAYAPTVDELARRIRLSVERPRRSPVIRVVEGISVHARGVEEERSLETLQRSIEELRTTFDPAPFTKETGRLAIEVSRLSEELRSLRRHVQDREDPHVLDEHGMAGQQRAQLVAALAGNRITAVAQPVADLRRGVWRGVELLVRIVRADGTHVPPHEFLPTAEAYGLSIEVDEALLAQARSALEVVAEPLKAQSGDGPPPFIALNVSSGSLGSPRFLGALKEASAQLADVGLELIIEVTESALVVQEDAAHLQAALVDANISLAIDDFGTGYSSLAHLRRLDPDYIKIDRSFLHDTSSVGNEAILRSIISISEALGAVTIAEGVEASDTLQTLATMGVELAQGYGLGRPVSLDSIGQRLADPPAGPGVPAPS